VRSYLDTSALVAVYVSEAHSGAARREVRAAGQVPWTRLHALETGNALRLLRGRGAIDDRQLTRLSRHVQDDRDAGLLVEAPLDLPRVFDRACALSDAHAVRILSRSLDILHVAAALELECRRFVSADDRQLLLAAAVDLEVVDIKVGGRKAKR
jgi:predicted nucleic acid-binding protein